MPGHPYSIERYGVGDKLYGGGRSNPTSGPVDPLGYKERDAKTRMRRNTLLRWMKANAKKDFMDEDWLGRSR